MMWLLVGLVAYLAVCLLLVVISVRPPRTPLVCSPGGFGAPQEPVEIDGRLSAWWVEAPGAKSVAVLCHGYFLSKSELAPIAYVLWQQGISCLLFDFRAHGKTKGGACSFGYREQEDVLAAVDWVHARVPDAKIVLIGSSMGSVASVFAFAKRPDRIHGLVLDSAYNRLSDAVLGWWNFLGGWPLAVLLSPTVILGMPVLRLNPFTVRVSDALEKLKGRPVLVMHGSCDTLASPKGVPKNLRVLGPEAECTWFEGCGHSEGRWEQPEKYRMELFGFLRKNGFLSPEESICD